MVFHVIIIFHLFIFNFFDLHRPIRQVTWLLKQTLYRNNNSCLYHWRCDGFPTYIQVSTNRRGRASGSTGTTIKLLATGWIDTHRPRCKSMHSFCSRGVHERHRPQKFSCCNITNTTKSYGERERTVLLPRKELCFFSVW